MNSLRAIVRIMAWFGVAFISLAAAGAILFWLIVPDMCGNTVLLESLSPDGTKKVVVFERSCGATTGFSTQASVLPANTPLPNEKGNLFISDSDHGAAPEGPEGGLHLTVTWENAQSVVLTHHPKVRVFKAEPRITGIQVRYATSP